MKKTYDVLTVGSGTAGIYFAKLMAEQGYSVCVCDAAPVDKLGARLNIFHTDQSRFETFGIPEPKPGDEDYVTMFEYGITKSAFDNYPKRTDYAFSVLLLPPFLKRLRKWAEGYGVEFYYNAAFKDFTYASDGKINGAVIDRGGEKTEISARLVADCSGIPSVARRKLKDGCKVENFEISDRDKFYVVLRYVKLKNPDDYVKFNEGWAYYKTWIGPSEIADGAIFGVGANLSYEYAEKCYKSFTDVIKLPEHELDRIEKGVTPYRRPPYSLVADGFICMGDAACMTKPYSGEGITSGWVFCKIAAEVAGKVMKDGAYPTEEKLWEANVRYFTTQGADFANTMATLVNAIDCTPEENDYEFKHSIVFKDELMTSMNKNFKSDMPLGETLKLAGKVIAGIVSGNISLKTVKALLRGITSAGALKSLYKKFPSAPEGFWEWTKKADKLWQKAGTMADMIDAMENEK
ncbi:MAG: hypothetical protein LBQ40_04825 [Clostridiales bacterium]|jgi:electron-transferring-flavoprotein dehydrogenase|nr:hypothetical protein [Clostridiales bacterium]